MSIPEHISTILPRVLLAVGAPHHPQEAGVGMNEFAFETARETHDRVHIAAGYYYEFQKLWAAYHAALAVDTFRMTQEQREQNEIEVAEAFQALHRLSQEAK